MWPSGKVDIVLALGLESLRRSWRNGGIEISDGRETQSDDQTGGPSSPDPGDLPGVLPLGGGVEERGRRGPGRGGRGGVVIHPRGQARTVVQEVELPGES